jgi:hypothetical protein
MNMDIYICMSTCPIYVTTQKYKYIDMDLYVFLLMPLTRNNDTQHNDIQYKNKKL